MESNSGHLILAHGLIEFEWLRKTLILQRHTGILSVIHCEQTDIHGSAV